MNRQLDINYDFNAQLQCDRYISRSMHATLCKRVYYFFLIILNFFFLLSNIPESFTLTRASSRKKKIICRLITINKLRA